MKAFYLATCVSILISMCTFNVFAKVKNRKIASEKSLSQIEQDNSFEDELLNDDIKDGYEMNYTPRARSTKYFATQGVSIRAFAASLSLATRIKLQSSFFSVQSGEITETMKETTGLSFGYSNLTPTKFGFSTYLNYFNMNNKGVNLLLYAIESNIHYSINNTLHLKLGLNFPQLVEKEKPTKVNGKIGTQIGLGLQFNKNTALDLNYIEMNGEVKETIEAAQMNMISTYQIKGTFLGLSYTF